MGDIRAAIIGTGKKPDKPGLSGWAMAYFHGDAYEALPDVRIVACADIKDENAQAFAERYHVPTTYRDYKEMFERERPDIVSITTWPHLHAQMILDAIDAGVPAVHCEKPMATSFGDIRRIMGALERGTTRLTFNHQRRLGLPIQTARKLLADGVIGAPHRFEAYAQNLFDYGVNSLDVLNYIAGDPDIRWVMGSIDRRRIREAFGVPTEYQGVATFRYETGADGTLFAGGYEEGPDLEEENPAYRISGSDGFIELNWKRTGKPVLRYVDGQGLHEPDMQDETIHGPMPRYINRAIEEVVDGLKHGRPTLLDAIHEYRSMQIIFGAYESVRRTARIDMPMQIEDSPLFELLSDEAGASIS